MHGEVAVQFVLMGENPGMGSLRTFLLSWNRLGRGWWGSAAFPEPPQLHVPDDLRHAIDEEAVRPTSANEEPQQDR